MKTATVKPVPGVQIVGSGGKYKEMKSRGGTWGSGAHMGLGW